MQFADGELLNIKYEEEVALDETQSFDEEINKLSNNNVEMAAKFRDVVKDDVREKFSEILKEVSEELDLPEGDVDKDEAMAAMTETLDKLMNKLAGTGDKIQNAQKQAASLRKITGDKAATDDILNLKRDNQKSVKKDLRERQVDILPEDGDGGEGFDDEQTNKIVKKLEGTIRDKLSKLGLDTGGRPIEVKLITTQIPEGLEEGMEGDKEDMQVQGMFFNMMTGNMQGYEDINSQRKVENNYKFSWNEQMVDDIEKKIDGLGGEPTEADVTQDQNEPEEIVLTDGANVLDIFDGGDQRERPSSASNRMEEAIAVDENQNEGVFAQEEENLEREEL